MASQATPAVIKMVKEFYLRTLHHHRGVRRPQSEPIHNHRIVQKARIYPDHPFQAVVHIAHNLVSAIPIAVSAMRPN
jgi:hypothetical protein